MAKKHEYQRCTDRLHHFICYRLVKITRVPIILFGWYAARVTSVSCSLSTETSWTTGKLIVTRKCPCLLERQIIRLRRVRGIRWIIRVRQIKINTSKSENGTVLILDGQSAWLYPSVFPSILTDFQDGLSVSSVKTAIDTSQLTAFELIFSLFCSS